MSERDIVERLRGTYRVPVNDGAGQLNGSDEYVRRFPTAPILQEAADRIETLEAEIERLRSAPAETPTGNGIGGYVVAEDEGVYAFFDPGECPDGSVPPEAVPALLVKGRNAMLSAGGSPIPAPEQTEASVPTRTSEQGLSYHDGTEALREALEEIKCEWEDLVAETGDFDPNDQDAIKASAALRFYAIARRALSQHVGGEG